MFKPSACTHSEFVDSWRSDANDYRLEDVSLEIHNESSATFSARAIGPDDGTVWVRCWVSNAVEGSQGEAEVECKPGPVQLEIKLDTESIPELACIRIESTRFETKHTMHTTLCKGEVYYFDQLQLELESVDATRQMIESLPPESKAEMSQSWLELVSNATESSAWIHGFAVHRRDTGERVGNGGFKGPPANSEVEIAYSIDEPHQGQGFATTVAQALAYYAFGQSSELEKVIAHTLPQENASTRVLTKSEFKNVGEANDPDDGLVWRWERKRDGCN